MLDQKIELLQQVPLFAGLPPEKLEAIAVAGEKKYFEAGENLVAQGGKGDTSLLILTGKAVCTRSENGQALVEDLWPGTLVGELAMLVETEHTFTVAAAERLRALAFSRAAFRAGKVAHPEIARHISEKLLVRLHALAAKLREVDTRLAELEKAA
jgi:CRP/FNR family cyclic AMP-dependent transcriptional regulator